MNTMPKPIEAAVTGMHAVFPDTYVYRRDHEATITCDMLQFWLRKEPLGDSHYEFTLSFLSEDARRWVALADKEGVEHFNIEFQPNALWREMRAMLNNPDYLAQHPVEGLQQLVGDLEDLLGRAKQALAKHRG